VTGDLGAQSLRYSHAVRVRAPNQAVWQEIETIDLILAKIEEVRQSVIDDRHQSARIRAHMAWGPFARTVDGTARILEMHKPQGLTFTLQVQIPNIVETGRLELSEVASEETNLRFETDVRFGRLSKTVRNVVDDALEAHNRGFVETVATMAERHWLAHQRLQGRDGIAEHP
jgi:carbon monoxide dehydrogenase subunit G